MNKENKKNDFLDNIIIRFLQSFDKKNFSQKDKIVLFKEFSYLMK
jgi:hypothetical protein